MFCIFSQSNILKFSVNYEKLREVLRPFSLLHQTIGRIYHFWVEYQEVLRPFSLLHQKMREARHVYISFSFIFCWILETLWNMRNSWFCFINWMRIIFRIKDLKNGCSPTNNLQWESQGNMFFIINYGDSTMWTHKDKQFPSTAEPTSSEDYFQKRALLGQNAALNLWYVDTGQIRKNCSREFEGL